MLTAAAFSYALNGFSQDIPNPSEETEKVQRVSAEELKRLIETGTDMMIVDIRPAPFYQKEHIKGAVSFPWSKPIREPKSLKPDRLLIIYCDCEYEVTSADLAIQLINEWGFKEKNIKVLKEGWMRWKELGYPTVKGKIASFASPGPPIKGERLPEFRLPIPKNREEKRYLGLSGQGSFKITQVKAGIVIIEVTSLYCPFCQKEAPKMNELYQVIEKNQEMKGKIKLIGIGAGNSVSEMEVLRKTYTIPFPLFPDKDFTIHKVLGEVRTPYLIAIKICNDGTHQVIYSEQGMFQEAESFLQVLTTLSGLK